MIVKFEDSMGVQREIGRASTRKEANEIIHQFLLDRNYISYYWRFAYYPDYIWVDVGSWSEFFYIYPETEEERELLKPEVKKENE